jgi:Ca-activated chloride channel family protein
VSGNKDYYALLGVPRSASLEQLRRAYREAALRLHPDRNIKAGDTELFLEIGRAYEVLSEPARRAEYDKTLADLDRQAAEGARLYCGVLHSRRALLPLDEPQVHYMLLDIVPSESAGFARPPINVCIVIDKSTSMRGQRLDQVRSATLAILKDLQEGDSACIVAFSDRAEVIVSHEQAHDLSSARSRLSLLQAGGGTEIGQGLELGMTELTKNFAKDGVNHLILLTDGRTYGDEDLCLQIADRAAEKGITLNGVGIGADWSDRLLDDIAGRSGGNVLFLDTPKAITDLLQRIFDSLSKVFAGRVRLEGAFGDQVDLRSSFRLLPDPMPTGDTLPMVLGHLPRDGRIRLLLEVVVHPASALTHVQLADFQLTADVLGEDGSAQSLPVNISLPVSKAPDTEAPPNDIVAALSQIALYTMQEKARHEAELGQSTQAARRLENLATQLLAVNERELAKAALGEAERLTHSRRLSTEGEKVLKYGTRALLLLPAKTGSS